MVERKPRTYGTHYKLKEDELRCVMKVWDNFWNYQCRRKRGHGKDGLYCKQHAKMKDFYHD